MCGATALARATTSVAELTATEEITMPAEARAAKPRRVKVAGYSGVYYRLDARGRRVYEHDFYDSSGVRHWKVVGPNLKSAVASREELRSRIRRGERLAPTKATVGDYAEPWLQRQTGLRPRTLEKYVGAINVHIVPVLGRRRLADLSEDDVLDLIADMRRRGYAEWTIRGVLTPLGRMLSHATRRGLIATNPMLRLERGERPTPGRREQRVLSASEIERLLVSATPTFRPLLATAAFTGLRLGELLGLIWSDIDFDAGFVRVRKQLDRDGERVKPKTPQAVRDVVLMPALGKILVEHRLASPFSRDENFVFASAAGTPFYFRNVERRGLRAAAERAALDRPDRPRLRLHDLRHTFASLLIAHGADVVSVSRQLGHASPDITLKVYAHLYDQARNAQRTRDLMEAAFGEVLERGTNVPRSGS